MNDWATPTTARLVYEGNGIYKATLSLDRDSYEFKIGSMDWKEGNFGGHQDGLRITVDAQVELFRDRLSHNFYLDLASASAAEYTFTVDASNLAMPVCLCWGSPAHDWLREAASCGNRQLAFEGRIPRVGSNESLSGRSAASTAL